VAEEVRGEAQALHVRALAVGAEDGGVLVLAHEMEALPGRVGISDGITEIRGNRRSRERWP
jgi:hypothetical protein